MRQEDNRKDRERPRHDRHDRHDRSRRPPPEMDEKVKHAIQEAENAMIGNMTSYSLRGLNAFQRKMVHRHFEKTQEYRTKTYRDDEDYVMKIYPVGQLRRFAEQKAQEVLMHGESATLPAMGAFERFVIHEYLKDRGGIRTESDGEGENRHIEITPIFGRTLKKAKRRLSR